MTALDKKILASLGWALLIGSVAGLLCFFALDSCEKRQPAFRTNTIEDVILRP